MCLRRLGLELAAGGVKRPFEHWRAVAAPDVEPENSGSNSSRHRKTTKRKTQCCQSLRHLLLKRAWIRDPSESLLLNRLGCRSAPNPRAEQQNPFNSHGRPAPTVTGERTGESRPPSVHIRGLAQLIAYDGWKIDREQGIFCHGGRGTFAPRQVRRLDNRIPPRANELYQAWRTALSTARLEPLRRTPATSWED